MHLENGYILSFPEHLTLSDDEFFELCRANPELNLERDAQKRILIMAPSGTLTDFHGGSIFFELSLWNKKHHHGKVFSSSAGFTLPDGSVKSPDCAWVSNEKWNALSREQKEKFAPICPEFVVEVRSPSDSLAQLQQKMTEWMANGVRLGWLVDTANETLYGYESGQVIAFNSFRQTVSGGDVLPGFILDLSILLEE